MNRCQTVDQTKHRCEKGVFVEKPFKSSERLTAIVAKQIKNIAEQNKESMRQPAREISGKEHADRSDAEKRSDHQTEQVQ